MTWENSKAGNVSNIKIVKYLVTNNMNNKEKTGYALIIIVIGLIGLFYLTPVRLLSGHGVSMKPRIHDGDAIIIYPTSREQIRKGDIITFRDGEGWLITHKVVGFENDTIITHGINLPEGDVERVRYSQVVGELVLVIPKLGMVLQYVNSGIGFVLLILLPAALIIFNESRKIREELNKQRYIHSS